MILIFLISDILVIYVYITTSVIKLSKKTSPMLSLKVGRSAMTCFHLLRNGYDAEVMIPVYVTEPTLSYLFHY